MKPRFPRADAIRVAKAYCDALKPITERLVVAGSLRRRKPDVGDIELLYIPRTEPRPALDFFAPPREINLVDEWLDAQLRAGRITKRTNLHGHTTGWGERNKFATDTASGIPLDFFAATVHNWWNYLVCRTGSAEHNQRVATAALARGLRWDPYSPGFRDAAGHLHRINSERDLFTLLDLPYREPWER